MGNDIAVSRFWDKVAVAGDDECWEWQACRTPAGYGKMKFRGRYMRAPRISYLLEHGADPGELCVLHTCDNPPCVNPRHLFLGTRRDNARDRSAKGRTRGGRMHGNRHAAKLSVEEHAEIRVLYARGGVSQQQLGRRFGITQTAVWWIVHKT